MTSLDIRFSYNSIVLLWYITVLCYGCNGVSLRMGLAESKVVRVTSNTNMVKVLPRRLWESKVLRV